MSFQQASPSCIGERLVLLIPELRERYENPNTGVMESMADGYHLVQPDPPPVGLVCWVMTER